MKRKGYRLLSLLLAALLVISVLPAMAFADGEPTVVELSITNKYNMFRSFFESGAKVMKIFDMCKEKYEKVQKIFISPTIHCTQIVASSLYQVPINGV